MQQIYRNIFRRSQRKSTV